MAQQLIYENDMQSTVNFETVSNGACFVYSNNPCIKLNNNNPNYVIVGTGIIGKLENTDQVALPDKIYLTLQ